MPRKFRPMLAAKIDDSEMLDFETFLKSRVTFPVMVSPKVDGIRFMGYQNTAMSRSWKPLPNRYVQNLFSTGNFNNLDGEIIVGNNPTAPGVFNKTQSAIMTRDGDPEISMFVFDHFGNDIYPFRERNSIARICVDHLALPFVHWLKQEIYHSPLGVMDYELQCLEEGWEGIMIRSPSATYKYGRSTIGEQGLIKVKRFADEECKVVGFEALERNTNEPTKDAFGLQKRSSHNAGKIADALLGKLLVSSDKWGEFAIGSGFDVSTRKAIWDNQQSYLGRTLTFKYQAHGSKDKPRTPIFKGFRPEVE